MAQLMQRVGSAARRGGLHAPAVAAVLCGGLLAACMLGMNAATSAASAPAARPTAPLIAAASPTASATPAPTPTPSVSPSPAPQKVPTAASFRKARSWLAGRYGYTAFAVVDSSGKLYGWNQRRRFISGSVTKAMLLVSYLRSHVALTAAERDVLTRMIELSDNRAADVIYGRVGGDRALRAVARLAGMNDFAADRGFWGYATITAADQVRFFYRMDGLIPQRHRAFARHVLSNLIAWQRYGLVKVGRWYGWQSFTKGGWRSGLHGGRLIHQISRLEKDGVTIAVAVLTDGQPTRTYARETIQGVALKLLRD
jgi:hypothetical protein